MARLRLLRNPPFLVCLALAVAIVAVYARALGNAPVWDDSLLVTDNPTLRSFRGLFRLLTTDLWTSSGIAEPSSYYRPVTTFTYWITVVLGGGTAALRLGNVLIHAANAMLLALFAHRVTRIGWIGAGLTALLWALAPLCSEPVLWIAGRFDLPVATFALLALLASRLNTRAAFALSLSSIAAGLFSKESFIGWIPLVVLDDLLIRRVDPKRYWMKLAAIGAIVGGFLLLRRMIGIPSMDVVTGTGVIAIARSLLFLVGTFVRQLVWPDALDPYRPYVPLAATNAVVVAALVVAAFGAATATLLRHRDSARARVALFGLAWFVCALGPSAVAGPNLDMVGDRYAYMPLIGLFLSFAALVATVPIRGLATIATVLCMAEGWVTLRHAPDWRNDESLAESSLKSTPGNPYSLYVLGSWAAMRGDLERADALLARSLEGNAGSWRTWNAICFLRLHQGRLTEGEAACKEAVARHPKNPRSWVNLASIYVQAGRWEPALLAAAQALAVKPRYAEARYLAAVSAANLGAIDVARAHIAKGLLTDPRHERLRDLERQIDAQVPRPAGN
jgi:tetratricopeptide (TPR) repeat protein